MSDNTKYIFLSPHLDDAIFSCGDYISKLTSEGEIVLVIPIFSGYPLSQQLQPSAKQFHKLCNLGKYPIEERKKEDRLACERLQCDFRHLSYYECLYRKDRNGNFLYRHIYSKLKNEDTLKNDIIKELLMHLDDKCVVYCPLSLGDHVDHVFVNSIGRALEFMRYKVIYYEDFPYVSDSSMVSYMGKTKELKMYQEELDEKHYEELDEKHYIDRISSILCYKSQILIIWKSVEKLLNNIKELYLRNGAAYSIRFWIKK